VVLAALSGEERLKNTGLHLGWHALAVVPYAKSDVVFWGLSAGTAVVTHFQLHLAPTIGCITGIDDQIEQGVFQVDAVGVDVVAVGIHLQSEVCLCAGCLTQQVVQVSHELRGVQRSGILR
jgi:hypothetical protein